MILTFAQFNNRTTTQVKSHGQKYLKKMSKRKDAVASVDSSTNKVNPISNKNIGHRSMQEKETVAVDVLLMLRSRKSFSPYL